MEEMYAWLVNGRHVLGYYHLTIKGDKCRDRAGREYPLSFAKEDISEQKKMRFAKDMMEDSVDDAMFFAYKSGDYSSKDIKNGIHEIKNTSWETIIAEYIESVRNGITIIYW